MTPWLCHQSGSHDDVDREATFDPVDRQDEVVAASRSLGAEKPLKFLSAGPAREVALRDDWNEEPCLIKHLIQLVWPVLADADTVHVLEDLERLAGHVLYRVLEKPTERTDAAVPVV